MHRGPVAIAWHDPSRSFLVGTYHDGTIYRGRLEDPTVPVYIEGRRGQTANGIKIADAGSSWRAVSTGMSACTTSRPGS